MFHAKRTVHDFQTQKTPTLDIKVNVPMTEHTTPYRRLSHQASNKMIKLVFFPAKKG